MKLIRRLVRGKPRVETPDVRESAVVTVNSLEKMRHIS